MKYFVYETASSSITEFMRCAAVLWIPVFLIESVLLVSIDVRKTKLKSSFLVDIAFCKDCSSPDHEGSLVKGLLSYWSRSLDRKVGGAVVYGLPNHGEKDTLINTAQLHGNVALLERGKVEVLSKAQRVQKAGAVALIIADDGSCTPDLSYCGRRAGGVQSGFAPLDEAYAWMDINIPVIIISSASAERLCRLMTLSQVDLPRFGIQNVSDHVVRNFDSKDGEL